MKYSFIETDKASSYLSQISNDFLACEQAIQTNFDIFSDLCSNLLNRVTHKKTIPERSLWDFNKMTIGLIRDTLKQLPTPYIELVEQLSDYWRYELESETNSERMYSYIRLYQASSVLKAYYEDRKEEEEIVSFLDKYEAAYKLLDKIKHMPSITLKMLQESLRISAGNLSPALFKFRFDEMNGQLDSLEKDGFLLKRGPEEHPYYVLTNAGDSLYKKLNARKKGDIWSYRWTHDRLAVFYYMIIQLADKHSMNGYLIQTVLQIILKSSDAQITQCMKKIETVYQNVSGKNDVLAFHNINNKWLTVTEPYFSPVLFGGGIQTTKKEHYENTLKYVLSHHMNVGYFNKKEETQEMAELMRTQNR